MPKPRKMNERTEGILKTFKKLTGVSSLKKWNTPIPYLNWVKCSSMRQILFAVK